MPEVGLKASNVGELADRGRRVELSIPVARLERVAGHLADQSGEVTGSVALSREAGRVLAQVQFEARLTLRCQRCLGPQPVLLSGSSEVVLVGSEEEAATVPAELETALAPDGRLDLAELVEEELLLALPAAPRHAAGECPAARPEARASEAPELQRPFARLGELLAERSKH